jgi:protein LTV1
MPPKRWIDKKNAETYSLVHRSQEDPLSQDPDAPQAVLVKLNNLNRKDLKQERREKYNDKIYTGEALAQEEEEFRSQGMRGNEGEAALYGIEYDDSKYDYMQHLKSIGTDPDAVFIARKDLKSKGRKDADLMLKADYAANNNVSIPTELLPSTETVKRTYQDQQGIPDAIAGLQPDMDPRLREVLE